MSMRPPVDRQRIEQFLRALGQRFHRPGKVYLVGGTTLVFEGWRRQSLDIDIAFEVSPHDHAAFVQAVRQIKDELGVNVEQASPGDFIPLPAGYAERSRFIGHYGQLEVFHFDLYSTALSKIARGTAEDFADVLTLVECGQIEMEKLQTCFDEILPRMADSLKHDPQEFELKFETLRRMNVERETQ